MSIQIAPHEDLPSVSTIIAAMQRNEILKWRFRSGNWSFTHTGTYKQAAYLACKNYRRIFNTNFGNMFIMGAEKVEIQKQKQKELSV